MALVSVRMGSRLTDWGGLRAQVPQCLSELGLHVGNPGNPTLGSALRERDAHEGDRCGQIAEHQLCDHADDAIAGAPELDITARVRGLLASVNGDRRPRRAAGCLARRSQR